MAANIAYDGARIIGRPSSPTAALAATVERRGDEVAYRFRQDAPSFGPARPRLWRPSIKPFESPSSPTNR